MTFSDGFALLGNVIFECAFALGAHSFLLKAGAVLSFFAGKQALPRKIMNVQRYSEVIR